VKSNDNRDQNDCYDRRGFLQTAMRMITLAGLAALTGVIGWGRRASANGTRECFVPVPCRECGLRCGCPRPQAARLQRKESEIR